MKTKYLYISGTVTLMVVAALLSLLILPTAAVGGAPKGLTLVEFMYPSVFDLDYSVAEADLIVEGVVKNTKPAKWGTPDGRKPNGSIKDIVRDPFARIVTSHEVSVSKVLKGDFQDKTIEFLQLGGRVGSDEVVVADRSRQLNVGEQVILFLSKRDLKDRSEMSPDEWSILQKYSVLPSGLAIGSVDTVSVEDLYLQITASN